MLAIAAVTLSTMHQSSLGSLFLLMPDKLEPAWWSPVMPVYFFLSSIAAGTALVVLVEMWIAKAYGRQLRDAAARGDGQDRVLGAAVYEAFRLGDLAFRGQLGAALPGPKAALFLAELALGGLAAARAARLARSCATKPRRSSSARSSPASASSSTA